MDEIWKDIDGFEELYQISNFGHVRNVISGKILSPILHDGYLNVTLYNRNINKYRKTIRIHKLVLETFRGPRSSNMECRHIDGNPLNNKLNNLEYGTHTENMQDRIKHGRYFQPDNRGQKCGTHKLTDEDIPQIRRLLSSGRNGNSGKIYTQLEISKIFGISRHAISEVKTGKTWSHI